MPEVVERAFAVERGLKRYFTGKACPHGHIAERKVSDRKCVECGKVVRKMWTEKTDAGRVYKSRHKKQWLSTEAGKTSERERRRRWELSTSDAASHRRLARSLRTRLRSALRDGFRSGSAVRDLGCTIPEFRSWLTGQFLPVMTWENYGSVWHIDHVKPLASFDLSDAEQLKQAVHFTNLQPLLAEDNLAKGSRR